MFGKMSLSQSSDALWTLRQHRLCLLNICTLWRLFKAYMFYSTNESQTQMFLWSQACWKHCLMMWISINKQTIRSGLQHFNNCAFLSTMVSRVWWYTTSYLRGIFVRCVRIIFGICQSETPFSCPLQKSFLGWAELANRQFITWRASSYF